MAKPFQELTLVAWERFYSYAEAFFEAEGVPGGAVVIVQGDEVVLAEGFGVRNVAGHKAATPDTIFGVASLTKSFTALALLLLAADGKLELDDPLRAFLPAFRYPSLGKDDGGDVSLRHAASHTSGVPPLPGLSYALRPSQRGDPGEAYLREYPGGVPSLETTAELLTFLAAQRAPPVAAPGQLLSYQNDVYALLGAVIETVSDVPYAQFVETRILAPLGMTRSSFELMAAQALGNVTTLYAEDPQGQVYASPQWEDAPAHLATGFLKALARDLGRYLRFLLEPTTFNLKLSAEQLRQLWTPHAWCAPQTAYGLGMMVRPDYHGVTLVRHGGGLKGVSSHLGLVPKHKIGVAVLLNLEDKPVSRLWLAAVNTALGLELDTPYYTVPTYEAPLAAKQKLVGRYLSLEPWGKLEVELRGGALFVRSGENLDDAGRLWLAPNSEFFVGSHPHYDGGRVLYGEAGKVRGVQFGTRYLARQL